MAKQSPTNATTTAILEFFRGQDVFCWRNNVLPVPISRAGSVVGYRPGSKSGVSDIIAVAPCHLLTDQQRGPAVAVFVEVKTGKDKLRPEQIGFKQNLKHVGGIYIEAEDFEDLKRQWFTLTKGYEPIGF
jgi:hypothetical protein